MQPCFYIFKNITLQGAFLSHFPWALISKEWLLRNNVAIIYFLRCDQYFQSRLKLNPSSEWLSIHWKHLRRIVLIRCRVLLNSIPIRLHVCIQNEAFPRGDVNAVNTYHAEGVCICYHIACRWKFDAAWCNMDWIVQLVISKYLSPSAGRSW